MLAPSAVSFDSLLAAALAEPAVAPADPVAVVGTEQDALQSEDGAADSVQSGELAGAGAGDRGSRPCAACRPRCNAPAPAAPAPLAIDALAASLAGPACRSLRALHPRLRFGPRPRPRRRWQIPVRNCRTRQELPCRGGRRNLPAARQSGCAPSPPPLSRPPTPIPRSCTPPDADAAVSVVPVASERAETSARPPVQPVRLDIAAPVAQPRVRRRGGQPAGVDGYATITRWQSCASTRPSSDRSRFACPSPTTRRACRLVHRMRRCATPSRRACRACRTCCRDWASASATSRSAPKGSAQGNLRSLGPCAGLEPCREHALPGQAYPLPGCGCSGHPPPARRHRRDRRIRLSLPLPVL